MGPHFQMILEFHGYIAVVGTVIFYLGEDVGLAPVPAVPVTAAGHHRRITEDADSAGPQFGRHRIRTCIAFVSGGDAVGAVGQTVLQLGTQHIQLVFRSRPAGYIVRAIPGQVGKAGDIIPGFRRLVHLCDSRLIAYFGTIRRQTALAAQIDVPGQLEGQAAAGAIAVFRSYHADVSGNQVPVGIFSQLILGGTSRDCKRTAQCHRRRIAIVTTELQPIAHGGYRMGRIIFPIFVYQPFIPGGRGIGQVGLAVHVLTFHNQVGIGVVAVWPVQKQLALYVVAIFPIAHLHGPGFQIFVQFHIEGIVLVDDLHIPAGIVVILRMEIVPPRLAWRAIVPPVVLSTGLLFPTKFSPLASEVSVTPLAAA